jgi:succinylglutamic semialdehyde dehydrogenase
MPGNWDAEPQPFMGGLISEQAAQHVYDAWQRLASLGPYAVSATSGESRNVTADPGIIELTGAANVPDEEVFGPLLGVWRYDSFDEAIRVANNTRFGLSCGLVSPDRGQFEQLLLEARAGIVNWNKPLTGARVPHRLAALALPGTIAPARGMPQIIAPGRWQVWNHRP